MEKQIFNNTLTYLMKEEDVTSLDHHILPNTTVLELAHPFPGYYSESFITSGSKPQILLILLKEEVNFEFFYRRLHNINKYAGYEVFAAPAVVHINNKKYHAIRVIDLDTYDKIAELEKYFIDEGFLLRKPIKINANAIISIHKFCNLVLENEVYSSNTDNNFIYFATGKQISWQGFAHVTQKIRHNYIGNKFDAGLGVLFHSNRIEDVVRIYSKDLNTDDIEKLKSMYQKEIREF